MHKREKERHVQFISRTVELIKGQDKHDRDILDTQL
jgi:hypothetical protein